MPDLEQRGVTSSGRQWQGDMPKLPSFYSPRQQPAAPESHAAEDVDSQSFSIGPAQQPQHAPGEPASGQDVAPAVPPFISSSATSLTPPTGHYHFHTQEQQQDLPPPPPSLVSPAFTPPSTPGSATPLTSVSTSTSITSAGTGLGILGGPSAAPDERPPRGVPVDSSVPGGGCGTKRPQLLATLPEVQCIVRARIPTTTGTEMYLHLYTNNVDNKEHLAIVFGNHIRSASLDAPREGETEMDRMIRGAYVGRLYPGRTTSGMMAAGAEAPQSDSQDKAPGQNNEREGEQDQSFPPPLVRIHSECYTGETAWSARCDCGEQLDEAARLMSLPSGAGAGAGGIIIYLRQEGRGIGLGEKLKAYNLQDLGSDTVEANLLLRHPADARSYGLATAMLRDLGQREIRLLTNNPDKIRAVEGPNREVRVVERVAMVPLSWKGRGGFRSPEVEGYLKTKIEKMGHMLDAHSMPT